MGLNASKSILLALLSLILAPFVIYESDHKQKGGLPADFFHKKAYNFFPIGWFVMIFAP